MDCKSSSIISAMESYGLLAVYLMWRLYHKLLHMYIVNMDRE